MPLDGLSALFASRDLFSACFKRKERDWSTGKVLLGVVVAQELCPGQRVTVGGWLWARLGAAGVVRTVLGAAGER